MQTPSERTGQNPAFESTPARVVRVWLTVALCTVTATVLPHGIRLGFGQIAGGMAPATVEWWSALLWLGALAVGARVAMRCGLPPVASRRWSQWRRGVPRFALASLALVALLSTRTSLRAPAFDGERAHALVRTVLLPALTEELVFRGMLAAIVGALLTAVVGDARVRAGVSLMLVSLTFALAHEGAHWPAPGWPLIAARFAAGLVFGALALCDGTLLAAMLAHAMYDAAVARCW